MKRNRRHRIPILLVLLPLLFWLAAPLAAQEPTPEPPVYVVQPGDTLYSIAQRFGTTVEAIAATNDIADPSLINVGQKLVIPTPQPEPVLSPQPKPYSRVHPVHPGETLPFLAFRYGTTVWTLHEVNDLGRLGLLVPGLELTIPPPSSPGFPQISARPAPAAQGQTMLVKVQGQGPLALNGCFLGQDLRFVEEQGQYWALMGIDALTPPGGYPLTLSATEADSGDLLTMQETFTVTAANFPTYNIVIPPDRQGLLDPALIQAEWKKVNAVFATVTEKRMWAGTFGYPLAGELHPTAPFGQRRSYNGGPVNNYHSGQDYGADVGLAVYAPMTGTVALAEPLQVRGQVVILDHGWGVFTGFWHLSEIRVTAGQVVGRGEIVGLVGNTGLSTGPHLHWEMEVWAVPVNPLQWTQQVFP